MYVKIINVWKFFIKDNYKVSDNGNNEIINYNFKLKSIQKRSVYKMSLDHKYIYLKQNNTFAYSYLVKYDFKQILKMINDYSIKKGATIVNKTFLGSIRTCENGRIISEKETVFPETGKITFLSSGESSQYDYVILENESEFIKNLLKSFQKFDFPIACHPYELLNFSKIYDMLKNKELNGEDIKFLSRIFEDIKIDYKSYNSYILPHGTANIETDALKNSYVLNLVNKINALGDKEYHNIKENSMSTTLDKNVLVKKKENEK